MINTSPRGYCYIEVGRQILGGQALLSKVDGYCQEILGRTSIASITRPVLIELPDINNKEKIENRYKWQETAQPVLHTKYVEIPPANELRLVLMHRGWPLKENWRYGDSDYLKIQLKNKRGQHPSIGEQFKSIANSMGQELEPVSVKFNRVQYLSNFGSSLIIGLLLDEEHITTRVLKRQAEVIENKLKDINPRLYGLQKAWTLAMAVARIEINETDLRAKILLEELMKCVPTLLTLGDIKVSNDDVVDD